MAITDEDRNHLYNTLRETLGAKDAARMMDLLPPVGWADVARRQDVDHLERTIERRFGEMERRFGDIDRRFSELPQLFSTKDDLRAQTNRYIGWMVATNATLVAAVSLVVSLG
jgi:hypothetical protein